MREKELSMKSKLEICLRYLNAAASRLDAPFLLLIRLYWGWQFAQTGWGKFGNMEKVVAFFTTLGIPFPSANAHFIAGLELIGGILLVLGLASRPISLMLTVNMLVAYITADRDALFSFLSDPDKFTAASPFTFLMASLIVLIFGPGRFSLDSLIGARSAASSSSGIQAAAARA
jgi:putative oxidoreductase